MTDDHAVVLAGRGVPMLDKARMYVCGITPYDVTHLGHAATFVWVDALGRVLRLLGVEPEVCRNVTDVDDVLDAAASRASAPYDTFAAIQQYHFEHDLASLNVRPPRHEPRAHRYIEHVIRLARGLIEVGRAYEQKGSVYFRGQMVAARRAWTVLKRCGSAPSTEAVPTIQRRRMRSMPRCGRRPNRGIQRGIRPGDPVAGMARRMRGHGDVGVRRRGGYPCGRERSPFSAPRLPFGHGRGVHRGQAVRARLASRRGGDWSTGSRWPNRSATWYSWKILSGAIRPPRCG